MSGNTAFEEAKVYVVGSRLKRCWLEQSGEIDGRGVRVEFVFTGILYSTVVLYVRSQSEEFILVVVGGETIIVVCAGGR